MSGNAVRIRTRLIPALLTALGVTLLAAGLLTYTSPVTAVGDVPSPTVSAPADSAAPTPLFTLPPITAGRPSATPSAPADRVATRVRIAALDIDLPIIIQPNADYPACNVAMYLTELGQPGQGRAIYLYAHAREGMFLPMLDASKVKNGKKMLGMIVEIWTSDDQRFLYVINEVRRHQVSLDDAIGATNEQLWLQTSEGPKAPAGVISPKLQVIALPLSQEAADPVDAHPKPHPVDCS
jgi:hypothetical protein